MLPGAKVSEEIAEIRGIEPGVDCASPSRHTAFSRRRLDARLRRAGRRRDRAPGRHQVGRRQPGVLGPTWSQRMAGRQRGVDFVNIDGGEGGTGAAPMIFADAVAYPFRVGFAQVYRRFAAGRPDRRRHVRGRRQARHPGERDRRLRARRRPGQRRPRGDAVDRLHPGAEVPHRPLPGRRRHAEPALRPRPRPDAEERARRQLRQDAAPRPAQGLRGGRRRPTRPDHARRRRRDGRRPRRRGRCARSTGTTTAGACPVRRSGDEIDAMHGRHRRRRGRSRARRRPRTRTRSATEGRMSDMP